MNSLRGTHDLYFDEMESHKWILNSANELFKNYGFSEISTPIMEFTEVFKRTLGESSDVVHKQMYTFNDNHGESITLRPEGTAGVARAFVSNGLSRDLPIKWHYHGPMFRYERPQKGRQRQFYQVGVELLGVSEYLADVEVLSLAHSFLKKINILDKVVLDINTIGDKESRNSYKEKLISYLKPYESELSEDSQRRLTVNPLRILDSKSEQDQKIIMNAPLFENSLNKESLDYFDKVKKSLSQLGIEFQINPRLVRGLDYYNHCVFEFKSSHLGAQDAVLSGGRYDGLIELMGGSKTPGVGWAAGMERLALLVSPQVNNMRPVSFIPIGDEAEAQLYKFCKDFREYGLNCDFSFTGNMKKRLSKASKVHAKWAIIAGESELSKNEVIVKDLDSQEQKVISTKDLIPTLFELKGQ